MMNPLALTRCATRVGLRRFGLSHVDVKTGTPVMVDVSHKTASQRIAHARATVSLPAELTQYIAKDRLASGQGKANEIMGAKGPVFATAIIAGVMAAKKTADLIPFCHPVALEDCKVTITMEDTASRSNSTSNSGTDGAASERTILTIDCIAKTTHKTGVEMEAMVGATNAAMCIYDMLKAVSHDIVISEVKLMAKSGGKSTFQRT